MNDFGQITCRYFIRTHVMKFQAYPDQKLHREA
jgi:hypothetical protein